MSFSDVPGRRPVVRLGKVSEAAAALLAGESDRGPFLTPRENDRVPSQNALPLSEGLNRVGSLIEARHPAKTEISPPQPLPKQPQFPRESFPPSQTPVSRSRHLAICAAVAAVLVTIGFGVLLIATDLAFSTKTSDWKKVRRELAVARERERIRSQGRVS